MPGEAGQRGEKGGSSVQEQKKLRCLLQTFGCQMNEYDSQVAIGLLKKAGFEIVCENGDSPQKKGQSPFLQAASEDEADIVIMNTCSVREHAEDRVFGRLGMLGKIKRTKPDLMVGLMGCMVEEHREKLFKRFPQLDFMVGTRNISELPSIIEEVSKSRKQVSKIKQDGISIEYSDLVKRHYPFYAWLPIMTGCNKVCTYCIVPITRGTEVSMPAREVYREASRLASDGVKWITLLGQNVNSYNGSSNVIARSPEGTTKQSMSSEIASASLGTLPRNDDKSINFPELLEMLCEIEGLQRISFTTSHPQDATEELFQVIARNPKISRRFHLPLQSGSDKILKRMKRLHTYQEYREKVDLLRRLVPDIAVTTDIIVGFSGETDEDYEQTANALRELHFEGAYIYKYSLRKATPAAKLPDDVPFEVKNKRNQDLLDIQKKITIERSRKLLGTVIPVFVEKRSTKHAKDMIAKTEHDRKVVFEGDDSLVGQFVNVRLRDIYHETLIGTLIQHAS